MALVTSSELRSPPAGVPGVGDPFLLGINYWPRRKAMEWWQRFDADEVREDFTLIRELGLGIVRCFLRWEDFQPEPEQVAPGRLRDLETVAEIAVEAGVRLEPTFFCGHMSGPNWAPRWLLAEEPARPGARPLVVDGQTVDRAIRNLYVDPEIVAAEEHLVREVAGRLVGHPGVWAWSLGNEPDLFCQPPTPADGRAWTLRIVELIHQLDPGTPVTIGLHTASLEEEVGLHVDQLAEVTDFSVMHGYSIYAPWAKHPLDSDVVPFANALTAALAGRPVLFEEYGLCTAAPGQRSHYQSYPIQGQLRQQFFPSEEEGAEYYRRVLAKLHRIGALGAFGWCFADYVPELWDRPPCDQFLHERSFGLVRPDGSLKPIAEVLCAFAATRPTVQPASPLIELGVTPDEYYQDPSGHLRRLFAGFAV
jgi:endo-1,4-beta-mannosidase